MVDRIGSTGGGSQMPKQQGKTLGDLAGPLQPCGDVAEVRFVNGLSPRALAQLCKINSVSPVGQELRALLGTPGGVPESHAQLIRNELLLLLNEYNLVEIVRRTTNNPMVQSLAGAPAAIEELLRRKQLVEESA